MKDELAAGIKNAMQRGSTLDQAMQSFVNAGYSPSEVQEAAQMITSGVSPILYQNKVDNVQQAVSNLPEKPQQPKQVQQFPQAQQSQQSQKSQQPLPSQGQPPQAFQPPPMQNQPNSFSDMAIPSPYSQYTMVKKNKEGSHGKGLIIILVLILLLLVGALLASLYYKDQIINLISNLKL